MQEHTVVIQDIWLMRESDYIKVYVKRDGIWYEAIREYHEGPISHCITSNGIEQLSTQADWLNKAEFVEEAHV